MLPHHAEYEVEYYCPQCGATYVFKGRLQQRRDAFGETKRFLTRPTTCIGLRKPLN
ncbi:MAG: hypothetical protein WC516_07040 [Patescibacteria group bacterium]|jgi:predicted RNA-binding Zn-ribbon protein involved in translation (DUF1610 family)